MYPNSLVIRTVAPVFMLLASCVAVFAGDTNRTDIRKFLDVTGFGVALDSMKLSAGSAPVMLGLDKDDFGNQWSRLADRVFDTQYMHQLALDILEKTLSQQLLDHANAFYSSEFGQRIVSAENASHMEEDDGTKTEAGEAIVSALVQRGSPRIEDLKRMTRAVDADGNAIRAVQEIQFRFLMAAASAGVIELRMDGTELRSFLEAQEPALRQSIALSSLSGAAFTYQAFSDMEVAQYADALEDPVMQEVYTLMNAVQYEIMANRFEALAAEMAKLQPSTDL